MCLVHVSSAVFEPRYDVLFLEIVGVSSYYFGTEATRNYGSLSSYLFNKAWLFYPPVKRTRYKFHGTCDPILARGRKTTRCSNNVAKPALVFQSRCNIKTDRAEGTAGVDAPGWGDQLDAGTMRVTVCVCVCVCVCVSRSFSVTVTVK